ncbi:gibberellin-regulated protein 14-like [Vicia villosa]|uniref:gibberellin-regulated protein 14-like n=1 Tax=Vicia villosa TaxID=3911 RepID=UPI00273B4D4E|nr:gibberellin-regulated protein 14-like [Vicia villosa]
MFRMSCFLVIMFVIVTFGAFSEAAAHHHKKPTSAVVVGTVFCDTCFQQDFSMGSRFISGASVEVECKNGDTISKPSFKKQVKTNNHGEFTIQLPFSVSKHVKRIKQCIVKLVSSNEPYCSIASTSTSSSLHLKSKTQGLHIFSAGFFSFKPLKQPNLCNQKPSSFVLDSSKRSPLPPNIDPSFPPPLRDPDTPSSGVLPLLPPIPLAPEILTPILPPVLSPLVPSNEDETKEVESSDEKVTNIDSFNFPPNPFLLPPLVANPFQPPPLVPNPLQPPTQTPLIPNPFQPPPVGSPSPLFPFPPTSSSPPPSLSFPFPPLFPPRPPSSKNVSP